MRAYVPIAWSLIAASCLAGTWLSPRAAHAQEIPAEQPAPSAPSAAPPPPPAAAPAAELPPPPPPPPPAAAPPPPPPPQQYAPPPPPPPANDGDYGGRGATPPPRARDDDYEREPDYGGNDDETHEFSVRLDPLNWLLEGRLGLELEAGVWKFISVEMVPVFVTSESPPAVNFAGFDSSLTQHSNGLGPISGASLGAGFWLSGEPFSGYVLRTYFTNYGYTYKAHSGGSVVDKVSFTERRFVVFFGSHSRFGPFTLAGGFGLGYELNSQERCGFALTSTGDVLPRTSNCNGHNQIKLDSAASEVANLNGPLHPFYLEARFSLGFVF